MFQIFTAQTLSSTTYDRKVRWEHSGRLKHTTVLVLPYLSAVKINIFIFFFGELQTTHSKLHQLRSVTYHEAFCSD